jgi:hypothetical protein
VSDDVYVSAALADLKHHWSTAYMLWHPEPDRWVAQRRDNDETLVASTPGELLRQIRADYRAKPVPRQPGEPRKD